VWCPPGNRHFRAGQLEQIVKVILAATPKAFARTEQAQAPTPLCFADGTLRGSDFPFRGSCLYDTALDALSLFSGIFDDP
jgi:hypothetical protein